MVDELKTNPSAEQREEERQVLEFQALLEAHFMDEVHKGEQQWNEEHMRRMELVRQHVRSALSAR